MLQNLKPLLNFAAVGTGIGLLYGTARIGQHNFGLTGKLDIETDAFHMDKQATHIFLKLQKYQKIAEIPYRYAVLYTDKLLYLEAALAAGVEPNSTDVQTASSFIAQIHASCKELIDAMPISHQIKVEILVKDLFEMLDLHMGNICNLCLGKDVMEPESKLDKSLNDLLERYT